MKRSLTVVFSLVAVLALALVGATFAMGIFTEKAINAYSAEIDDSPTLSALDLDVENYKRGLVKSTCSSKISVSGIDDSISLDHEVYHGPFAFTPDGTKAGYSYIISTLNVDSLSEDLKEGIQSVYGDAAPFSIKTTIQLDGDRQSVISITALDHETDEMTVRFDGGEIEYLGDNGASSMSGSAQFSPLSLQGKSEDGDSFRLRFDGASATFSGKEDGTISMDGTLSKVNLKSGTSEAFSCTMDAVEMLADYAPIEEIPGVLEGSASVTIPSFEISAGDEGKFTANGLKITNQSSNEQGKLLSYKVTYGADSFRSEFPDQGEDMAWMKILESGVELVVSGTVPHAVAEEFATFQQEQAGIATTPESIAANQIAIAELLESVLRKLNKGSGFALDARVGSKEGGVNLNLDLTYDEERPITSRKSYLELLNAIDLTLSASVPKTMLDAIPDIEEQIKGLKAMGTVKETLGGYESTLIATDGKVTVNGKPNPMFEQMAPMLMTAIPWDGIFEGMRMAAEAKALDQSGEPEGEDEP